MIMNNPYHFGRLLFLIFSLALAPLSLILAALFSPAPTGEECQTQPQSETGENHAPNTPSMQHLIFTAFAGDKRSCVIEAEAMSLRDQRIGDIIFNSFKEVVISNVSVRISILNVAETMDWAGNPNIIPLVAPILTNGALTNEISLFATKVVIENLKV